MIKVENLVGGYGKKPIINGLNLEIEKGEFFSLLGPNGSGKTTLFKLITGQLPLSSGEIFISGKAVSRLTKLEKARKVSVLAQESQVTFDYTVEEIISLGRYPHQKGILKSLSTYDREVIDQVTEVAMVGQYRKKQFRLLSGGEKQRVLLAKALAQEPEVLLLDEPTNHLDIKHTFQMLDLLKQWQLTKGLTIFAILHDLNVASLYSDRVALLHDGAFLNVGDVNLLRNEAQLKEVYEVEVKTQSHPLVPKPQLLLTPNALHDGSVNGENFSDSYIMQCQEDSVITRFNHPLRTISNADSGSGIQWMRDFCLVNDASIEGHSNSEEFLLDWMKNNAIPSEQALGIVGDVKDVVIVKRQLTGVQMMAIVTLETRIHTTKGYRSHSYLDAIHTMVFVDDYLEDKALFSCHMAASEAKVKACRQFGLDTVHSETDCLVIAATQQQQLDESNQEKTLRESVSQLIIAATTEALEKKFYDKKVMA